MRGVIDADEKNIFNLFPYLIDIYIYSFCLWMERGYSRSR